MLIVVIDSCHEWLPCLLRRKVGLKGEIHIFPSQETETRLPLSFGKAPLNYIGKKIVCLAVSDQKA